jgi:hypothetical protein
MCSLGFVGWFLLGCFGVYVVVGSLRVFFLVFLCFSVLCPFVYFLYAQGAHAFYKISLITFKKRRSM